MIVEFAKSTASLLAAEIDTSGDLVLGEYDRVQIAGPMSGISGFNRDAFDECARAIWAEHPASSDESAEMRDFVSNPASEPDGLSHDEYMRRSLSSLAETWDFKSIGSIAVTDFLVLLPGWELSRGAVAEAVVAHSMGIQLIEWRG